MSGIVGSKLNIRGSGLVGSYGTDGQHLLSAGAGVSNVFETAAGGGVDVLQHTDIDGTGAASFEIQNCFSSANDDTYGGYKLHIHCQSSVEVSVLRCRYMTSTNTEVDGDVYHKSGVSGYRQVDGSNNTVASNSSGPVLDHMQWTFYNNDGQDETMGVFVTVEFMGNMYGGTAANRICIAQSSERDNSASEYMVYSGVGYRCHSTENLTGIKIYDTGGSAQNGAITLWGMKT